ncbi:GspH/FimT family pseudopilin [Ralstonia sp. 21MJYT02-11]|uniref:Type II secretion system protein H n=1 Tax=Ralstonia soli TaxID=2953896 RepID=A0ABT1ANP4_9RALS|nr:GspH/FimT family pseudopilin [Ralstonia soli]MCO5400042.1 GspH/FimT family pseudopilin [Ralstonia soli]
MTLVELLAVVVILGILAAVAFPSFQQMYLKIRLEGVANELRTDLQYARTESIRLRSTVNVTSTANGSGYSLTDASSNLLKSITLPAGVSASNGVTVTFDSLRGFATNTGGFVLSATNFTPTITVSVDATGRVWECTSSGAFYGVTNAC